MLTLINTVAIDHDNTLLWSQIALHIKTLIIDFLNFLKISLLFILNFLKRNTFFFLNLDLIPVCEKMQRIKNV